MSNNSPIFSFDLLSDLRNDKSLLASVSKGLQRVDRITVGLSDGKTSREDLMNAQAELIEASKFNFGLLIPSYFTRYPLDDPLSIVARPFMFAMTSLAPDSVITFKAGRQVGKCATGDTEVITPDGFMTMEAIFDKGIPIT